MFLAVQESARINDDSVSCNHLASFHSKSYTFAKEGYSAWSVDVSFR